MTILLPALGVTFAAFCVWLAVRIVNRREGWAERTALTLAAALIVVGAYTAAYAYMVRPSFPESLMHLSGIIGPGHIEYEPCYRGFEPDTGIFANRDQSFWKKVFVPA